MGLWAPPERDEEEGSRRAALRTHGARLLLALALAVATYVLFPAAPASEVPVYEVGSVAPENVIAPYAFRVPKAAPELAAEREAALRTVAPVFAYAPAALDSARAGLDAFMRDADAMLSPTAAPDAAAAFVQQAGTLGVRITEPELRALRDSTQRASLAAAVRRVYDRWLTRGVASNTALDDVRGQVSIVRDGRTELLPAETVPTFGSVLARARRETPASGELADALLVKLASAFFRPTLVPDAVATERRRSEAVAAVPTERWSVRAGEKIVGAHEVVGREAYEKMRALRSAPRPASDTGDRMARVAGAILYNLVVIVIFGITLLLYRPSLYDSFRVVALFAIAFFLVVAVAAVVARLPVPRAELIPATLAVVVFAILFDPRIALIAAMVLAVLVGGQGPFRGSSALFVTLVGGVAAALSVRTVRRRDQAYYSMLTVATGYVVAAVALALTLGWSFREFGASAGLGALNAVVSVALAMGLLPPAEQFTRIDTYLRLLEWSDLNRPLMQRLSVEAPGTYAHTIAMANLAEAACNAIGANGLLARVGTYYHDIGKLKKPIYFVENQPKGRNPHDKLKPNTSASIIRNHVREGLELAEEYKLPRALRAFITEHHGTGRIQYFLDKAKERGDGGVNAQDYVYPGPIPQTAETAVCMLADGVEAAARVVGDPTPTKIRELVDHIVRQRMEQGQLRDAPLTLRQLEVVKEQFARVLIGMYHSRIDYPAASGGVTSEFASA